MEDFCISSEVLGSDKSIVVSSDGFFTCEKVPQDVWVLSGKIDDASSRNLDTLFQLENKTLINFPDQKWKKVFSSLARSEEKIMWSYALPQSVYKPSLKNLIKNIVDNLDSLPKDYYRHTWVPCSRLLLALKPAKVDSASYRATVEACEKDSGALETFKPGPGGFLPSIVYNRFGTRTGRLTVAEGPNILTLKKEHRKLLRSSYQGGKIFSIDFSALEARIILAEAGKIAQVDDLYADLSQKLFSGSVPRDTVKVGVLSELYGSSRNALGVRLGVSGKKLEDFIETIRAHFDTSSLRKKLKAEFFKNGKIFNRFGRPLFLEDPQDHIFVNTYAQSTGVDVSLLGFEKIVKDLGAGIRPLFVLHDALILDVREDKIDDVKNTNEVEIPTYSCKFPLKCEEIF